MRAAHRSCAGSAGKMSRMNGMQVGLGPGRQGSKLGSPGDVVGRAIFGGPCMIMERESV